MKIKGKVGINMKNIKDTVTTCADIFGVVVRNNNSFIVPKMKNLKYE